MGDPEKILSPFLPEGAFDLVGKWLQVKDLQIKISSRKGHRLGSYQRDPAGNQKILINRNQDCYSFLITLVHEIAHMQVRMGTRKKIQPHGTEWKLTFGRLLSETAQLPSLPSDVRGMMLEMANAPMSRQYARVGSGKVLLRYNSKPEFGHLLADLSEGERFATPDGKIYTRGIKLRTRYKCRREGTSAWYLVGEAVPVRRIDP
jgi:SprT protein